MSTCPKCTFHNHPDLRFCELCDEVLPGSKTPPEGEKKKQEADTASVKIPEHRVNRGTGGAGGALFAHTTDPPAGRVDPLKESKEVAIRDVAVEEGYYGVENEVDDDDFEAFIAHIPVVSSKADTRYIIDKKKELSAPPAASSSSLSASSLIPSTSTPADPTAFDSSASTWGLVDDIRRALLRDGAMFRICSPCPHITQFGYEGSQWACGYRNIQMLCVSLMARPEYKEVLFHGRGEVSHACDWIP